MTSSVRMTCATCGKEVTARTVRPAHARKGQLVDPLRVPVRHKNPQGEWCAPAPRKRGAA